VIFFCAKMAVPTHGSNCRTVACYPTTCRKCGNSVYYFECTCHSKVFFDSLEYWDEHVCPRPPSFYGPLIEWVECPRCGRRVKRSLLNCHPKRPDITSGRKLGRKKKRVKHQAKFEKEPEFGFCKAK
jgi:hypothetical protein